MGGADGLYGCFCVFGGSSCGEFLSPSPNGRSIEMGWIGEMMRSANESFCLDIYSSSGLADGSLRRSKVR